MFDPPARPVRRLPWNGAKRAALADLRRTLEEMEDAPEVRILRGKLDLIFPWPPEGGGEQLIFGFDRLKSRLKYRPCLKKVKTPKQRIFFRHMALKILEIHQVFLRIFALSGRKISRRWAFRHFSNKAWSLC